jgi:hypothetical protein
MVMLLGVAFACGKSQARQPPAAEAAPNARGDIKVHNSTTPESSPVNEPKVCEFYLVGFNFIPNGTAPWTIHVQPGTAVVSQGTIALDQNGHGRSADMTLPDGQYKVEWHELGETGSTKSKVFKVECGPSPSPSASATPSVLPTTPTPSPSEPGPSVSPSASESPAPTPTESETPTPTPSQSETPTPTPSESETPTPSPSESESPSPTPAPTATGGGSGGASGGSSGGAQVGGNPQGGAGTGGGGTAGAEGRATLILGVLAMITGVGAVAIGYRRRNARRSV